LFFRASRRGEGGLGGVRAGVQRGRASCVSSGAAVEGVAVGVRAGGEQFAAAGAAQPDYGALNEFRKRHRRALNDVFTQVVELALAATAINRTRIWRVAPHLRAAA
jgi:hypothetical protein